MTTPDQSPPIVLAIDDSELVHRLLRARLRHERIDLHSVGTAREGIEMAEKLQPDVILLDIELEDMDGFEVLAQLKANPTTQDIAVIFVSASNETMDRVRGLDLGAVDFVGKPFDVTELRARVRSALRMQRLLKMLSQRAQIDGLTGLWNRTYLDDRLASEVSGSVRYETPLSFVLCDVDRFKTLNDTHGHPFGDEVLEQVAGILSSGRGPDVACRYGGEEFGLIVPGTGVEEASELASRYREEIERLRWVDRPGVVVTASFGVADLATIDGTVSPESLIAAADQALYQAKSEGRNRVVQAGPGTWPRSLVG